MKISTVIALTLVSGSLAGRALAQSSYTPISAPPASEVSQIGLLAAIYGGSWSAIGATGSLTNGALTATRAADGGLGLGLDVLTGNPLAAQDDIWSGSDTMMMARAKYAADTHTFGWIDGTAATPAYAPLLSTSTFSAPVTVKLTSSFKWALRDLSTGQLLTSLATDNPGGADQMATYRITGPGVAAPTWLLAWEDRTAGSDRDFNDSAVELVSVPSPGALALSAVGAGLIVRRRRR